MAIDKNILRQAICDGAFNTVVQNSNGQVQRTPLTASVLATVASMTDDQIQPILDLYVASKRVQLNNEAALLNAKLSNINSQISALQATPASV